MKKSFRRALLFSLSLVLGAALAGCTINPGLQELIDAAQAAAGQTEIAQITSAAYERESDPEFGLPWDPNDSLNPLFCESKLNRALGKLLYSGLTKLDASYEPVPALCESWGLAENVYTVRLRSGLTFTDGSAVTAADAAYSVNLARTNPSSAWFAALSSVVRAQAVSDLVLEIETAQPDGALPAFLDCPVFKTDTGESDRPVGAGRYRLTDGQTPHLIAQAAGAGIPDIALYDVGPADGLVTAFSTRKVDVAAADPLSTDSLYFGGSVETRSVSSPVLHYIGFNTRKKPLDSAAVRRAFGLAVDRASFVTDALEGCADPAFLPCPSDSYLYPSDVPASSGDVAALFAEAGLSVQNGSLYYESRGAQKPFSPVLLVNLESPAKLAAANALAAAWKAAGIGVTVQALKWETFQATLSSGDFDLYYGETRLPDDLSCAALVGSGGALNYGKYKSTDTDTLLAALGAARPENRAAAAKTLYEKLAADAPILPLAFARTFVYTHLGDLTISDCTWYDVFDGIESWKKN